MWRRLVNIFRDESATSLLEYALIISLVAGVMVTSVAALGNSVSSLMMTMDNAIDVFYSRRPPLPEKEGVLIKYARGADTLRVANQEVSVTSSSPYSVQ